MKKLRSSPLLTIFTIISIVFIISIIVTCVFLYITRAQNDKVDFSSIISSLCTIIAALIAVLGVIWTIKFNYDSKKKELLDNLDSKSEWRKQLYDVASKTKLTTDDVFRVLSSLRFIPKSEEDMKKSKQKNFDLATQTIFYELYNIISDKFGEINPYHNYNLTLSDDNIDLTLNESEKVRLYTKYLLKHHWEFYNSGENKLSEKEWNYFTETQNYIDKIPFNKKNNVSFLTQVYFSNHNESNNNEGDNNMSNETKPNSCTKKFKSKLFRLICITIAAVILPIALLYKFICIINSNHDILNTQIGNSLVVGSFFYILLLLLIILIYCLNIIREKE